MNSAHKQRHFCGQQRSHTPDVMQKLALLRKPTAKRRDHYVPRRPHTVTGRHFALHPSSHTLVLCAGLCHERRLARAERPRASCRTGVQLPSLHHATPHKERFAQQRLNAQ